jgi:hypothetical protein
MGLALAAALLLVALPACQYAREHPKTATGAGVGAAGGAIAGGLISGSRKGMVWGGVLGALAGGLLGAYADHKDKSATETMAAHNYSPDQGVQLTMESVTADPQSVSPGQSLELRMRYALMAPEPEQEMQVTETRTVTLNGHKVVDRTVEVYRAPGTYSSTQPVTLPPDAPSGTYQMTATVTVGNLSSSMTGTFTVQ